MVLTMRTLSRLALLASAVVGAACAQHRRSNDLLSLERALVQDFHTDAIAVSEQHSSIAPAVPTVALTIAFTSSDAVALAGPDRGAFSRQVADYVRDHYAAYGSLNRIIVRFAQLPRAGSPTPADTTEAYFFTPAELGAPTQPGAPRP